MIGRRGRRSSALKKAVVAGSIAAAAGYIAGLLTAPKSGKQTRDELQKMTNARMRAAERDLKDLHTELGKLIDDSKKSSDKMSKKAQGELNDMLDRAKDTKEKVRELISAVREGEAGDSDLKKAINDARAAVEHLRDYLKK